MAKYEKPLPVIPLESAPYWKALRKHRLTLQHCTKCGKYQYPASTVCHHCGTTAIEWKEVQGKGTIYSFSVVHRAPDPSFAPDVPYAVIVVALDEGPRVMSNLVGVPATQVKIGMRVEPVFEDVTSRVTLLKFKPAGN
ncbi:MAG: Zn-ribbon domain-containing OB-fold protein [Dehalococcoidales bacterium]|nr:Zn-ribbon domain-containing OB-fold protein [Dehalococcoidales bacterium]